MSAAQLLLRRRRFMQAAGLTASGLFLPSLSSSTARAQGNTAPPKRIVLVFTELGWSHERLAIRRPGQAALVDDRDVELRIDDLDEAAFSSSLRPLHRHRDHLLVVENLALHSAMADIYGDAHARGWLGVTTGAPASVGHDVKSEASTASVDQIIVRALRQQNSRLSDLADQHFAVHHGYNIWPNSFGTFHFGPFYNVDSGGGPVVVGQQGNPQTAFDLLFPSAGAPSPLEQARPGVLEKVRARTRALEQRLSLEDRRKLETHHGLLEGIENRLRGLASCTPPLRMQRTGIDTVDDTAGARVTRYNRVADSFSDLIAASFACDITRVTTLFLTVPDPAQVGETGDVHHEFSHPSEPANRSAEGERARDVMGSLTAHYAAQIARLVDLLKAVPEGNGSVFDNTQIVWVNEISHGGHGHDNMSAVVVGGSNTAFRMGRTVRYGTTFRRPDNGGLTGRPFNQFLTSVARGMGVDVNSVGLRTGRSGGDNPVDIDLTGPAPLLGT